jgi:hypothetical protein
LRAVAVRDGWESIVTAYVDKYRPKYPDVVAGFPTIDEARTQITVFRLERDIG